MSSIKSRFSTLLLASGLGIVIGVAAYSYIEQDFSFSAIIIALIGSCLFASRFLLKEASIDNKMGAAEWGRVATLLVTLLLSVAFLIVIHYLSNRLSYRWDVTQYSQHTLSQETMVFLQELEPRLDSPIKLTGFFVGLPPKYLQDLLNEYERVSSGKVIANIVDPISDIAAAAEYGNVISSEERKLIVVYDGERRDIDFSGASLSEEQITNALVRITREPRQIYFLAGHGEQPVWSEDNDGLSLFTQLLAANGISSNSLMLGIERRIPNDCDVLIIAGPRTDLTDEEEVLITDYLEQGGDALFLIEAITLTSPDKDLTADQLDTNPSLNSILNHWGIHIGSDVIVDLASHIGGDQGSPATKNYGDHKAITAGLDYTFYIRPRSITALQDRRASIELAPIAFSASKDKSWAETDRALNVRFDKGADIPGPVALSYVIWEAKEKEEKSDTRIIVFTDADFLSNAYLNQYSNAAMGINIVNWLAELDYAVFNKKNIQIERLDLTSKQRRIVTSILFLVPLIVVIIGLFVWMRP